MVFIFRFFGYSRFALLSFVLFLNALLDLVGIVVLFPYIKLVSDPAKAISKFRLQHAMDLFGVNNPDRLVIIVGIALVALYTVKTVLVLALNQYQHKATANLTYRLTEEMYERLLTCRYSVFQQFPGSQLIYMIYNSPVHATLCLSAVATILNDGVFLGMFLLISLAISPAVTIAALLIFIIIGVSLQATVVRWTQAYGKRQAKFEDAKHKLAFATITAIKDIKVMGIEKHIQEENTVISRQFLDTTWRFNLMGSVPKTAIEYAIFLFLCIGIVLFLGTKKDTNNLLPMVGVGIAAMLRVAPSFTRMIMALNSFKFYRPGIDKIIDFYQKTKTFKVKVEDCSLPFKTSLEAKGIGFSYGDKRILRDVSISIPKGHSIGIVGTSGSGKSTFLDLISGIQEKDEGEFLLDGAKVDPFRTNVIRRMLGYVPQTIALVDESIAFNISFSREWDPDRLRIALKVANLLEFVDQLPDGERTTVGENGVRLSGGQRQRIGIARAMYKDPEILIFDEATSAVDNITEQELTREIRNLSGSKTLIMVAHRLSTILHCNTIYVIRQGAVIGSGTYQKLLDENEFFRELHNLQAVESRS